MDYREALSWIHGISRFGMKPGLERIEALLQALGNPHEKLNCIHIGGSNGKGSTAAFIASILEYNGYRVGLYTSPYLVQFTNRMAINGEDIDPARLVGLVQKIKPLVEEIASDPDLGQPTEFEVVTAIALLYFAEEAPDYVVFEVGLGGRLDATNVVMPAVTVITTVSLEHTQVLGDTVEAVAREKAGIVKEGRPVVTGTRGEALRIIEETCRQRDAVLYRLGEDFKANFLGGGLDGQFFDYRGLECSFEGLRIGLMGRHQVENAALALAALELLSRNGAALKEEAVRTGLERTNWPGRLEILRRSPLVVIDGAHNLEAFQGLRAAIQELFSYRRLIIVLGLLGDKAAPEILKEIVPLADTLILTRPSSPRAAEPEKLKLMAREMNNAPILVKKETEEAVSAGLSQARAPDLVLFAGSLYLISDVRRILKKKVGALL